MGKKGKRKGIEEAAAKKKRAVDKATQREVLGLCQKVFEAVKMDTVVLPAKQWEEHLKLREMVEMIRKKQAGLSIIDCTKDSREEHIPTFVEWFKQCGGSADQVAIERFDGQGLGLKALTNIKIGDMFCKVPRKVIITAETAVASELGSLIMSDHILKVMQNASLALHVLCEKAKEDSFWKPYLDILPSSYTTSLYFTLDELQALKGSPAFGEALKLYRNIARQYAYLYRIVQTQPEAANLPLSHFTFDDHRWAVSTIMTRQNRIPSLAGQPTLALIPMWDMCNHCNGEITTGYNIEKESCDSAAVRDFSVGEQVCVFYGERSNADFLVHNGFVFPGNTCDRVNIQLGISKRDPLYALKERALLSNRMSASSHPYPILYGDSPVCRELHIFLQVFSMTEDELKDLLQQNALEVHGKLGWPGVVINEVNEYKSWDFLETRLTLLLKQYKTTPEEDEELLRSEITEHTRLCVQLRIAEREVLTNAAAFARNMKVQVRELGNPGERGVLVENTTKESNGQGNSGKDESAGASCAQAVDSVKEASERMKNVTIRDESDSEITRQEDEVAT